MSITLNRFQFHIHIYYYLQQEQIAKCMKCRWLKGKKYKNFQGVSRDAQIQLTT